MTRERAKVAVLLSGTGTNMAALLYASRFDDSPYEIVLVASNDPDAEGLALARDEDVPTFALAHRGMDRTEHDAAMDAAIRESGAQYIALAGYMRILGAEIVSRWEGRLLNIHPSLLPRYKGLDTHARALEAGDATHGCSVHLVTPELDDGPVLGQLEIAIRSEDTPETLAARVKFAEHQLYPRVLGRYVGRCYDPDWLLQHVRELALAQAETEERPSHGAPGWKLAGKSGKYFAYFSDRHHGEEAISLLVKTSGVDEMNALIERDPERYYRPAYYGTAGWIALRLDRPDTDWDHVDDWLARSWAAVAPKRLAKLQQVADEF